MGFTEACMKINSYDNTQSRISGVGYHELVSLQVATICRDCLLGTRIDHRAITGIIRSWLLPHIWYSNTATPHYFANAFSPPLATLTRQDSRTQPEKTKISCQYRRMARFTGSYTQILPAETQSWRIHWQYPIHNKDFR